MANSSSFKDSDGNLVEVELNEAGQVPVAGGGGADGATHTAGDTDGTPMQGVYEATPSTVADGKLGTVGIDTNRNQKVTQATLTAGEDLTNDVLKTEQRFSHSRVTADTAIKSGAGFLHTLTFAQSDAAPTAGTIIVYDNTAETGTIIYSETFDTTVFRGYTVTLDVSFTTGLYIGFTTTADVGCTVSYR